MDTDLLGYKQLQGLVRERCGLVFEETKIERLKDALAARMLKAGITEHDAYCALLSSDPQEFTELVNMLTINETYFMREPSHIELIADRLVPLIASKRSPGARIRIVSAGCSSGEEAYSVAMALMDRAARGSAWSFDITGFDIDSQALQAAQNGIYSNHSFRGVAPELIERYFDRLDDNHYAIKDTVKAKVNFIKLNFMTETYPIALNNTDIILYRNVSIYFDSDTQGRIFHKLAGILNDDGYLLMSSSETLAHDIGVLTQREIEGVFLFQKGPIVEIRDRRQPSPPSPAMKRNKPAAAPAAEKRKPKPAEASQARPASGASFDAAIECAMQKRYDRALEIIDELLAAEPALNAMMLKASVLLNLRRFDEAEAICAAAIAKDRWHLESHILLALAAHAREDHDLALRRFKEALYIEPSCWLAHFYLADILRADGDGPSAAREYSIVINRLKRQGGAGHGLTYFPLAFSTEQIVHLCEHNLSLLGGLRGA